MSTYGHVYGAFALFMYDITLFIGGIKLFIDGIKLFIDDITLWCANSREENTATGMHLH